MKDRPPPSGLSRSTVRSGGASSIPRCWAGPGGVGESGGLLAADESEGVKVRDDASVGEPSGVLVADESVIIGVWSDSIEVFVSRRCSRRRRRQTACSAILFRCSKTMGTRKAGRATSEKSSSLIALPLRPPRIHVMRRATPFSCALGSSTQISVSCVSVTSPPRESRDNLAFELLRLEVAPEGEPNTGSRAKEGLASTR